MLSMLKKLFGFLAHRWVWQLLGVLAIALVIWFIGPLVAIGGVAPLAGWLARALAIVLVFAILGGVWLYKRLRANRAARKLEEGLSATAMAAVGQASGSATSQADEDLRIVQERFGRAISLLKQTRKGKRDFSERYLYELPWYVIIGPPGTGKTTLLANSELEFPLAGEFGKDPVKGVGGTRNCDWSFTNDAILLDTAGRWATQESNRSADAGAWLGFLDLLKRYRPRRPLNGVLVVVSMHDLMRQSAGERQAIGEQIRQRILELQERLKSHFPVYLVFNKCDLAAGFIEFFEPLRKSERAQVWGATFKLADAGEAGAVGERSAGEFDLLLDRLWQQVLERVNQERTAERKARVFGFPEQLASMRETVAEFVHLVFGPNRFQTPPMLRGVYFTSATQEGTPADRLMAGLAQRFGLDRAAPTAFSSGHGASYFINRLFSEIIFPEANLAGTDPKAERRRRWLRRAVYASILIGSLGLVGGWMLSYTQNQSAIAAVAHDTTQFVTAVKRAPIGSADFALLDDALQPLARTAGAFGEEATLDKGLGLYQGRRVSPRAQDAYRRVLATHLLMAVGEHLRERLRNAPSAEETAVLLKAYLMLGQPSHLKADHVRQVMALDWAALYPSDTELQARLNRYLEALLAKPLNPVLPLDDGLVQIARARLAETPLWQTVYSRIKRSAEGNRDLDYQLKDIIGRDGDQLFTSTQGDLRTVVVPGLYTLKGLKQIYRPESNRLFEEAIDDAWLYGVTEETQDTYMEELVEEVENRYAQDYLDAWDSMIGALKVRRASDIGGLLAMAKAAASPSFSPLRLTVEKVAEETAPAAKDKQPVALPGTGALPGEAAQGANTAFELAAAMSGRVQIIRQRMLKAQRAARQVGVGGDPGAQDADLPGPLQRVDDQFKRLHELTVKGRDEKSELDYLAANLDQFYEGLRAYENTPAPDRAAFADLTRQLQGDSGVARGLVKQAESLPNPVRGWVAGIGDGGTQTLAGLAQKGLDELWRDEVLRFCGDAIEGRYPFSPGAAREVKLNDFARFFAPDQLLDSFFKTHLAALVDTSKSPWTWRAVEGRGLGGSPESLVQLERAARIRAAFFAGGGATPKVEFTITPTQMTPNTVTALLNVDGQQIEYGHGAPQPSRLIWPAPDGAGFARIEFTGQDTLTSSISAETGDWAWFRLLDGARLQRPAGLDLVNATFARDGHSVTYEIRASSAFNPLQLPDLGQFRCPAAL